MMSVIRELLSVRQSLNNHIQYKYRDVIGYQCKRFDIKDKMLWKHIYLNRFLDHMDNIMVITTYEATLRLTNYHKQVYDELQPLNFFTQSQTETR